MKIGNNRVLAGLVLGTGAVSLVLGLVAGTVASIAVGAICCVVGTLYLANPAAVVQEREIELKNPFGMTLRRIPFASRGDLQVRDGALFVRTDGKEQKAVGGFAVHAPDLDAVARWIGTGRP